MVVKEELREGVIKGKYSWERAEKRKREGGKERRRVKRECGKEGRRERGE